MTQKTLKSTYETLLELEIHESNMKRPRHTKYVDFYQNTFGHAYTPVVSIEKIRLEGKPGHSNLL